MTVKEDVWIPTVCNMCFCGCHIMVHRVDGVVTQIEGNPDSPVGEGRVCAKGKAGIMQLYDPNRRTKPMIRTNPKKGIGIDPGWQEISWDKALDLMAEKMGAAMQKGPGKVMSYGIVANLSGTLMTSSLVGGVMQGNTHMSDICGTSIHTLFDLFSGTGNCCPDYNYTKYLIQFGMQAGTATRHGFNMTIRKFADARLENGMKLVVVDPRMSASAEKSDHWLPIRPGTDGELALSIANVLVNELGIYDAEYLKKYTNAPYLVNTETKRLIRDPETNKPYVWDSVEGVAKIFNDESIQGYALLGTYEVNGVKVQPAFQRLKDNLLKYTPEEAEKVTTIPAKKIRMVAKEFGEAASIGSTITIDGVEMPYRPAVADTFSGVSRHKHGFLSHWSILLLNILVGSMNVPGGYIGFGPAKKPVPETGKITWEPGVWEEDGMLNFVTLGFPTPGSFYEHIREHIKDTGDLPMKGLMPLIEFDTHFNYPNQVRPEKLKREPAEVLFVYGGNPLKNWGNHDEMGEWFKAFEFVVGCDLYLNDSSYFYDLFLPEGTYLERLEPLPNQYFNHHTIGGLDVPWTFALRQPVVPSRDGAWSNGEICMELAKRLQVLPYWNGILTYLFNLAPEYALEPNKDYEWEDVVDRVYKANFGEQYDLETMKNKGLVKYPRTIEEVYMILLLEKKKARIPLYFDFMLEAKEKIDAEAKAIGIDWDTSDYQPLPDWKPCLEYECKHEGYDLLPIYYTAAYHVDTWQANNPWIAEVSRLDPYTNYIEINSATARKKGLKDGDEVCLESSHGSKVNGKVRLTEGLHPECLAVNGGCLNSLSDYQPIAKGVGVAINNLIPALDWERYDHISAAYDQCVRVRISKVKGA